MFCAWGGKRNIFLSLLIFLSIFLDGIYYIVTTGTGMCVSALMLTAKAMFALWLDKKKDKSQNKGKKTLKNKWTAC